MALQLAGCRAIERGVERLEAFRHGNVRGEWYPSWSYVPTGRLDAQCEPSGNPREPRAYYVVFSYGTPIAWHRYTSGDTGEWTVPARKYSATTSNHQTITRSAIAAAYPSGVPGTLGFLVPDMPARKGE